MPTVTYTPRAIKWTPSLKDGRAVNTLLIEYDWALDGGEVLTEHHLLAGGLIQRSKTVPQWADTGLVDVNGDPIIGPALRTTDQVFDPRLWIHTRNGTLVEPGTANARPWTYDDVVLQTIAFDPVARALKHIERNLRSLAARGWRTKPDPRLELSDDDGGRGIIAADTLALVGVQRGIEVADAERLDNGEVSATYSAGVAASSDDADVREDGDFYSHTNTVLLYQDRTNGTARYAGMRFVSAGALAGATISAADLTTNNTSGSSDDPEMEIHCEDADSPATFSSGSTPLDRTVTTASTTWSDRSLVAGLHTTPDFASAVQEWADRAGAGSEFAVIFVPQLTNSEAYEFEAYDAAGTDEPTIDVTYTAGGGGGSSPLVNGPIVNTLIGGRLIG